MYQIQQLNSPLGIYTENLKKKKKKRTGKITYPKMERFLKFKIVIGYSLGIYWKVKVLVAQLCLTLCDPMTVARQAPLYTEFSKQEYWSG